MNILVTGGTGYIGSHTVVALMNAGLNPVIIDNLSNSHADVLANIQKITGRQPDFYKIDLCDRDEVMNFFANQKIVATIHFAAFKAVGESVKFPLTYYRNNLDSLINLLDAYQLNGLRNFIFSSSCSVYGQPRELPVTEQTPWNEAESVYAYTKQIGEKMLGDTIRVSNFSGISLRYFNPAGAHESALIGEYPVHAPNNLVPVMTQAAIGLRADFTVNGNDYDTSDGTCVRDYIHVTDVAEAHVAALKRLLEKKNKDNYEIFNLGSGKGTTVLEAIHAFERACGVKLKYKMGPRRAGDVEKVWADTSLAEQVFGWKARQSLESIMSSAWAWEKKLQETVKA